MEATSSEESLISVENTAFDGYENAAHGDSSSSGLVRILETDMNDIVVRFLMNNQLFGIFFLSTQFYHLYSIQYFFNIL